MSNETNHINCPHCGEDIDIQSVLYSEIEGEIKKKHKQDAEAQIKSLQKQHESDLEKFKNKERAQIKQELEKDYADADKAVQEELADKSEKLKELNKLRTEKAQLEREKEELSDTLIAKYEETLNRRIEEAKEKIKKQEQEKNQLIIKDKDLALAKQKEEVQRMQQSLEQGSMQAQGETQELAIEEWLEENFSLDAIEEIKKGAAGADCLQTVNTRERTNCGTIYYESKRTKVFQPNWIEKFKNDIRERNATIGVLVTQAMPPDMERLGQRDGIWICSFEEFKGLSMVLRETVIKLSSARIVQANRGDKMGLLYDLLTGNEFRDAVEAIVEGFTSMQESLNREKTATMKLWKQREKQIQKVILNTSNMYGSIQGIAGTAVADIPLLELDSDGLLADASDEIDT
jgi:hypothetical protein